jgi:hypothetical protein
MSKAAIESCLKVVSQNINVRTWEGHEISQDNWTPTQVQTPNIRAFFDDMHKKWFQRTAETVLWEINVVMWYAYSDHLVSYACGE